MDFPQKKPTSFDNMRRVRYHGHARRPGGTGGTVIGLTPNDRSGGARAALAVSSFPRGYDSGGGGADVEKEAVESSAYRDLRGDDSDLTYHKSVLTARWHEQSALGN